jgi:ribonuclease P protein component
MGKVISLKNRDFQTVYERGVSFANRNLVMYVLPNSSEENRIGISVSKKVGNSVVRHRVKRIIRESYRLNGDNVITGLDIVIIARKEAKSKSYQELEQSMLHLYRLHRISTHMSNQVRSDLR